MFPRPWTDPPSGTTAPKLAGCRASSHAARTMSQELLDLAFLYRCVQLGVPVRDACHNAEARAKVAKGLWVDLSQMPRRKPWRVGPMPTFTTSSALYSFELDQQLEPEHVLAAYGRPVCHSHLASKADMQDLVGNCMAAQYIAAVVHSVLLTLVRRLPSLWGNSNMGLD